MNVKNTVEKEQEKDSNSQNVNSKNLIQTYTKNGFNHSIGTVFFCTSKYIDQMVNIFLKNL